MSIGQTILDEVIKQGMVTTTCDHPVIFVWSGNVAEQLEAVVFSETGFSAAPRSDHERHGRKDAYDVDEIGELPCYRCGVPAVHQWNACADGNLWRPLCLPCDVALNRLALKFMGDPETEAKVAAYQASEEDRLSAG